MNVTAIYGKGRKGDLLKRWVYGWLAFWIPLCSFAQISLRHNLPDSIPSNAEQAFTVSISKGGSSGFAKYEISLPEGSAAAEVESRGGTFSYENKRARVVWVIAPPDSVFTIELKLITGALSGNSELIQKYTYIDKGKRVEYLSPPGRLKVYKVLKPERKMISTPKSTQQNTLAAEQAQSLPEQPKSSSIASVQAGDEHPVVSANPEVIRQQAKQFRLDSKKAYEIGSLEKDNAMKQMGEANELSSRAMAMSDSSQKALSLQQAKALRQKAESSNSAADKILSLSRNLEAEAIELETALGDPPAPGIWAGRDSLNASQNGGQPERPSGNENIPVSGYENKKIDRLSQNEINELKQQALQFRKDAADAMLVGLKEKETAQKGIQEADETIRNATDIRDKSERKKVLAKAEAAKQKAENDLQTSEKIIILSRTLEENAVEIERLIAYIQPEATLLGGTEVQNPATPAPAEPAPAAVEPEAAKTSSTSSNPSPTGLYYSVQVGAFSKKPDRQLLKKLGKYRITEEDGKYKVLVGSFPTREEAQQKRQELIGIGFDGFVVAYEKGQRKK